MKPYIGLMLGGTICYAAAMPPPFLEMVCSDSPVTSYVAGPAPASVTGPIAPTTWITTGDGIVTSWDLDQSTSTLWVFPTGSGTFNGFSAIITGTSIVEITMITIEVESDVTSVVSTGTYQAGSSSLIENDITSAATQIVQSDSTLSSTISPVSSQTTPSSGSSLSHSLVQSLAASSTPLSSSSSYSNWTSTISSPNTTVVDVGKDGQLLFTPNQINASIGEVVRFTVFGNYSVTQSDLAAPCTGNGGFDTGLTVASSQQQYFDFVVNVTAPIWFHWYEWSVSGYTSLLTRL